MFVYYLVCVVFLPSSLLFLSFFLSVVNCCVWIASFIHCPLYALKITPLLPQLMSNTKVDASLVIFLRRKSDRLINSSQTKFFVLHFHTDVTSHFLYKLNLSSVFPISLAGWDKRELKQPQRRRQQKPDKFAYLTMKNSIFARFARTLFIFWHFEDVLVLSKTWNDLFCSCVDDVSIWWQMFNFVFLFPKRWFQFNPRIVQTHFSSIMSLNYNWKMIAETREVTFSDDVLAFVDVVFA